MKFLDHILDGLPEFQQINQAIQHHRLPAMATGLSAIHKAHLIHHLCSTYGQQALVIAGDEAEAARLCSDINTMGTKAVFYPARDFTFREVTGVSREFEHQRISALYSYCTKEAAVLICCADAAMQYTIPQQSLLQATVTVKEGASLTPERMMAALLSEGYVRVEQVDGTGQFAVRGGIFDFFMPSSPQPCRIEFWGDE
ncbi:MAG TPA: transcription-repair coupling factor, partial [Ruminococcaceae bacterium]|nr:transcription-repair coupling factor [Oscillospiraceae bacterium]